MFADYPGLLGEIARKNQVADTRYHVWDRELEKKLKRNKRGSEEEANRKNKEKKVKRECEENMPLREMNMGIKGYSVTKSVVLN